MTEQEHLEVLAKLSTKQLSWLQRCKWYFSARIWRYKPIMSENKFLLLAVFLAIAAAVLLGLTYESLTEYWQGVSVEAAGVAWDVVLIVIVLGLYDRSRQHKSNINQLHQRISDFLKVDTKHAHAMIGSSIRQLNKNGIFAIDFNGIKLTDFTFTEDHGIYSIKGSRFISLSGFINTRGFGSNLTRVNFSLVNCEDVIFSRGDRPFTVMQDCNFYACNLQGANFSGVGLISTKSHEFEDRESWKDENGFMAYNPMFADTDLEGVSFNNASLLNIDFRDADNVTKATFLGAVGLETCYFDDGVLEELRNLQRA